MKIAVITDLHFYKNRELPPPESWHGKIADKLLLAAATKINQYSKPDVVVIAGDLTDDKSEKTAIKLLTKLKEILDLIVCPTIIIPGNHDIPTNLFFQVLGDQSDFIDIKNVRFVPFYDSISENTIRKKKELSLMSLARKGFAGQLVALQHVPIKNPPPSTDSYYRYSNANEILSIMHSNQYTLAISGHYHLGAELLDFNGVRQHVCKALCIKPFSYSIIELHKNNTINVMIERI